MLTTAPRILVQATGDRLLLPGSANPFAGRQPVSSRDLVQETVQPTIRSEFRSEALHEIGQAKALPLRAEIL